MTVETLLSDIYEANWEHIDFMENMNGGDCDCNLHQTLDTICQYAGITREED
jgi:hypothetical protein